MPKKPTSTDVNANRRGRLSWKRPSLGMVISVSAVAIITFVFTIFVLDLRSLAGVQEGEIISLPLIFGTPLILVSLLATVFMGLCAMYLVDQYNVNRSRRQEERTFRERVDDIGAHLSVTSRLLRELEDDLATRTRLLEERQADAERYERLASLNADQAKAIEDLVGRQFRRQGRWTTIQWLVSIVLAVVFGFMVNLLTPLVVSWFS